MSTSKTRVVSLFPHELHEQLKAQAEKEDRSVSNLVIIAVKKYLEEAAK
jgi:predicted HicB family RNase H-like nuclease